MIQGFIGRVLTESAIVYTIKRMHKPSCFWAIVTLFLLGDLLGASAGRAVSAAPARQSAPADHVVISEFRTRLTNAAADEFVEIFNPTNTAVDITGWQIKRSSACGTSTATLLTITAFVLQPGQHYIMVATASSVTNADQTFTAGIADDGGIALFNASGIIIDRVGMCAATLYHEGDTLNPLNDTATQNYERKPGGATSCYDTDVNNLDFALTNPNPQNRFSPPTVCSNPPIETSTFTNTPTDTVTPTDTGTPTNTGAPTFTATFTDTTTFPPTSTETDTPAFTLTFTMTSTNTSTATPPASGHLVISEFRTRGPNGTDDEFVEIFNPTSAAVNIGSWQIKKSSSRGTTTSTLVTITSGTILQPGGYYLTVGDDSSVMGANQTFSASIADDGGVALVNSSGAVIDQVGMSAATRYGEGRLLTPLSGSADQSYERKSDGATNYYDTDDNAADFALITPASPQSSGILMATPSFTPTTTSTRTPTPTRTLSSTVAGTLVHAPSGTSTSLPGTLIINEFLPRPRTDWNTDGKVNVGDEYIELINIDAEPVSLKNWKLADDGGSRAYTLPDITLLPRQIIVFFGTETAILLNDGGDTVRLIRPGGQTADTFTYPAVEATDRTWCRLPDGNGNWTYVCRPTLGRPNVRAGSEPTESNSGIGTGNGQAIPTCALTDSVPTAILLAECGSSGGEIWNPDMWGEGEIWLKSRYKWDMFIR